MMKTINVVGGGLSGSEVAIQLLERGYAVNLYEMRPESQTGAHKSGDIAELVCSNSLKSMDEGTASGTLKKELEVLGCRLLELAKLCAVPGGSALCVDRKKFSNKVLEKLNSFDKFKLIRKEVIQIDDDGIWIIATGPLSSEKLCNELFPNNRFHFYDAIAPIIDADSIDMNSAFFSSRYGKGDADYLNLPMSKEDYLNFYNNLISADVVELHDFEKRELFQGCMPIELIAKTGVDSMRFGPLKPVGIYGKNGERYYAVVQARKENIQGNCFNLVGFQTNLKYSEQKRVFSIIPALKNAEYLRYGSMHKNMFIDSPELLNMNFSLKDNENIFLAGQVTGVEGYVESIMSGLYTAIAVEAYIRNTEFKMPGENTISGALIRYIHSKNAHFQPMNANFGLLSKIEIKNKTERNKAYYNRACIDINKYKQEVINGF